jgi:hypothetical protein
LHVKIAGKIWTVREIDLCGLCEHDSQMITLQYGQKGKKRMDTLIHEFLHAARPDVLEADVAEIANIITDALWRDGWRREKYGSSSQ